jgi:hypothetical protein
MNKRSKRLEINDKILIEGLFPCVNWKKVIIKYGMPWYLEKSFAAAAALPDNFSKTLKIVYREHNGRMIMLDTLYHETIHIQQYQDLDKKFPLGAGFFRAFMMHYLGWTLALFAKGIFIEKLSIKKAFDFAYTENPLEKEAYGKGRVFFQTILTEIPEDQISFLRAHPEIIILKSAYNGRPPLWAFIMAIILCFLIFITKPILDSFAFLFEKIKTLFKKPIHK